MSKFIYISFKLVSLPSISSISYSESPLRQQCISKIPNIWATMKDLKKFRKMWEMIYLQARFHLRPNAQKFAIIISHMLVFWFNGCNTHVWAQKLKHTWRWDLWQFAKLASYAKACMTTHGLAELIQLFGVIFTPQIQMYAQRFIVIQIFTIF